MSSSGGKLRTVSPAWMGEKIMMDFPKDNDTPGTSMHCTDQKMKGGFENLSHSLSGVSAHQSGNSGAAPGKKDRLY